MIFKDICLIIEYMCAYDHFEHYSVIKNKALLFGMDQQLKASI